MTFDHFIIKTKESIQNKNYDEALQDLIKLIENMINAPESVATVFGSKALDDLCLELGRSYRADKHEFDMGEFQQEIVVTLATQLYPYGGHTRVILDLVKLQPQKKHVILLTDLFNQYNPLELEDIFSSEVEIFVAPNDTLVNKLSWLIEQIKKIQPKRLMLFNHHQDAIIVSALQPFLKSTEIIFYHHGDHHFTLGAHLPGVIHVDPHNIGYFNCKNHEHLTSNIYIPLFVEDLGKRDSSVFMAKQFLRTCSSGSPGKFFSDYDYNYIELIICRLKLKDGVHFHIGNLEDDHVEMIRSRLKISHLDAERFVHIPWVKSIWEAVKNLNIDLYISSFPYGGGRASVEVMGAGVPLLMHESYLSRSHGGADLVYEDCLIWRDSDQFAKIIKNLTQDDLVKYSNLARMHYEIYYAVELVRNKIDKIFKSEIVLPVPVLKPYKSDPLKKFLYLNKLKKQEIYNEQKSIIASYEKKLNRLTSSRSWKITKPLRWVKDFMHSLRSKKNF